MTTQFTPTNLGDLIDRTRDGTHPAVIDLSGADGPRTFTYAQIDRMADGVAGGLRAWAGGRLARGARIGVLAANCAEFLAVLSGVMRAGLVAVPVNHKFPPMLIEQVMRDAEVELVFADAVRRPMVPADLPTVSFGAAFDAFLRRDEIATIKPRSGESAIFLYTSGSTGRPKGVDLSHQSHLWIINSRLGGKDWSGERMLIAAPLYHMNALALAQLACTGHATIVLMPQFHARQYIDAIERHRCTWLTSVPPMMAMMLAERDAVARADLSSVRSIRMGSAPVSPQLHAALTKTFPIAQILNAYGTTECGPVVFGPHPHGLPTPPASVGYPLPIVELRLNAGVLEMKSPGMMNGYHKLPEVTAKATTSDGFYITGDVFRTDENDFYFFVGRTDDMFVSGGENIYPSDVERMLEQHAAVEQASVIAVPDELKGTKPVAFVVLRPGASATEDEIKRHALAHAPAYQHPRRVWFVAGLPLSGTNKVDRRALNDDAARRLTLNPLAK